MQKANFHLSKKKTVVAVVCAIAVIAGAFGIDEAFFNNHASQPISKITQNSRGETYPTTIGNTNPPAGLISLDDIPEYNGEAYTVINGNKPDFTEEELASATFEEYGALDKLGRATYAYALVSDETRPANNEQRESISDIKPTGWKQRQYDIIDDKSLYNRSHLIAWSLGAENANPNNLITGTDFMNQETMQSFEQEILSYIRNTGRHVLIRVTPIYEGKELVARGVHYEAQSIEDNGEGISINVFMWNVQPGIEIDYSTGANWLSK